MIRNSVVVVGSLNYDFILNTQELPKKGETMFADSVSFCCGGKGANQAVQCAKLGLKTFMVGAVGDDYMGTILLNGLKQNGIDTSYMKVVTGSSGLGIVHAMRYGNVGATIVRGANNQVDKSDIDKIKPLLQEAGLLLLQLEIPVEVVGYAISVAKKCGCKVMLNTAPALEVSEISLKECDVLVMNEVEAGFYTNKMIRTVEDAKQYINLVGEKYNNTCIFTLGKNGAVVYHNKMVEYYQACEVTAIETTGAGDSFIGGYAYSMLSGKSIKDAMFFSTFCSSITVQGVGAQSSMPELRDVKNEIEKYSTINNVAHSMAENG